MYRKINTHIRDQVFFATLDQLVPADSIYRVIENIIDWDYVRSFFDDCYNLSFGRPGYDPLIFVKIVLIQYIEGFSSVRKTISKIKENNVYRWFLGLEIFQDVPHHSTISSLYQKKFKNQNVFHKIFNYVLGIAIDYGMVETDTVFVDSTHVKANANPHRYGSAYVKKFVSEVEDLLREELAQSISEDRQNHEKKNLKKKEIEPLWHTEVIEKINEIKENLKGKKDKEIEEYSAQLQERKKEEPALREALNWIKLTLSSKNKNHYNAKIPYIVIDGKLVELTLAMRPIDLNQYQVKKVSLTDPESGWFHKGEHKHVFAYCIQTACDVHGFILSHAVFAGNEHDSKTFLHWDLSDIPMQFLVADAGYKVPFVIHHLLNEGIIPVMPYKRPMTKKGFFKKYDFVYDEYYDCYICPNNQMLYYSTTSREGKRQYKSESELCKACPDLEQCTLNKNHQKTIERHVWNDDLVLVEDLRHDPIIKQLYPLRKETIERDFAECKNNHGFRFTNYKGIERMKMETDMTYSVFNILKIARTLVKREEKNKSKVDAY